MRAVLFEGTPEEFARAEAMFRAGTDPVLELRSIELPLARPKAWPALGEEHCYQLAKRVLERAPARLVEALSALADAQNLHGEQTIEAWADQTEQLPEELGGMLAELGRSAGRASSSCSALPARPNGSEVPPICCWKRSLRNRAPTSLSAPGLCAPWQSWICSTLSLRR